MAAHLIDIDGLRFVPLVFTVVGVGVALTGLRMLVSHLVLRHRARRSPGVVTGLDRRRGDRGRTYYHPVVAFRTAEGRDVQTATGVGTTWRHHRPGDRLTVSYDPHEPTRVYLGSGAATAATEAFTIVFGMVFAAIGSTQLLAGGLPTWLLVGGG